MESNHLEMTLDLNNFDYIQEYNILMFVRHFFDDQNINIKKSLDPYNQTKTLQFYYFNERLYTPYKEKIILSLQPYKERNILYLDNTDLKKYIKLLYSSVVEYEKYILVRNLDIDHIYKIIKKYETRLCFHKNERELQKIAKYEKIANNFFLLKSENDMNNVKRIREGKIPRYLYYKDTLKQRYTMVKSIIKLSEEKNLPSMSSKFIVENLEENNLVSMFDLDLFSKLRYSPEKQFFYQTFQDIQEAIVYNIQLSNKKIHGIMLPDRMRYCVCYENDNEVKPELKIEEARVQIIKNLVHRFSENYHFYHYDLDYLVSISCLNDKPIFQDKIEDMEIEQYSEKDYYIYNFHNDLTTYKKNYFQLDRSEIEVSKNFTLMVTEKLDYIYDLTFRFEDFEKVVLKDYLIEDDLNEFLDEIKILFKRGYFLTDFGLYKFMNTSNLEKENLHCPEWFNEDYNFVKNVLRNIKIKYS